MLRDFKFLHRNPRNNPSPEDVENVPVKPKYSLAVPMGEDSSRAPLNTIQDPGNNLRFVQEQGKLRRSKTEKVSTGTNRKFPDTSFVTITPDKYGGRVPGKYKFGSFQINEPSSNAGAHNEDDMVGVGNGIVAKAAPRPTRSNGMANSNYSESISAQSTPTKSVSKPPNPGFALMSCPRPHANAGAHVGNFAANFKGVSMTSGPSIIVDANEMTQFDLKEDPSFWIDHNVQVIIRVRPLNGLEKSMNGYSRCLKQESPQTITWTGQPETRFTFDYVASELVDQETLFRMVGEPMVENCLLGYNSCIFAYGQTGSGKTYTMLGDIQDLEIKPGQNCGLIPRIFELLIARIRAEEEKRNNESLEYTCKCSFLEIYNEQITDLLDPSSTNLLLREDIKKGVYVENLSEFEVDTVSDILRLLAQGSSNRKVAATNMNRESSRSHSVFTCVIESRWENDSTANLRFARLNLVDLAGSERQKSSGAEGERLREAANINKSLSTLGHVIMVLVDVANGKPKHVPYRDSRLTFLLQDSLGGNSKTMIIANVSPSFCGAAETLNTLKFAQRAKLIQNNAVVNEDTSGDVMALQHQLVVLKEELSILKRERIPRSLSFDSAMASGSAQRHENVCMEVHSGIDKHSDDSYLGSASKNIMEASSKQLRSYEAALAGSLRREQIAEASIKQLEAEIEEINHLIYQREKDTQGNKMILKFREDKIQRMESVILGLIPVDSYLSEENRALHNEIQILKAKINQKNPEVTRFASENIKLSHQLRRFQEFYEEGERKLLVAEVSELRDQVLHCLDGNCSKHNSTSLNVTNAESLDVTKEKYSLQLESKTTAEELDDCSGKLHSCVNENARLCSEIESLHFNLQNEPCDLDNGVKPVEELALEPPLSESCVLKSVQDKNYEEQQEKIMKHDEEVIHLVLELDLLKIFLKEERLAALYQMEEKEKLMGLQQSLEKAKRLNMRYQSDRVFHASSEEEMDEIRKQAEVETAEVIVCLQEELATLQQQIQDSNIKVSESENCIMCLETELEELHSKLYLATKDNQMLGTLVEEKILELRASSDVWEQLSSDIFDVLADGNEALIDASDQLDKKNWIYGQFAQMMRIISGKEVLIEELNKCLDDVNNSKNDVDSMLSTLKDATMVITEEQKRVCSEKEKRNLLLLSEIDSKIHNITVLEKKLRMQADETVKVSLCATAAFVIVNRLSEMNTNHLKELKGKDTQLKESVEMNLEKDGLLQEHSKIIDEAKRRNQKLEMKLETSEENCAKLREELEALKDKDIQLNELSEMNLKKDGLIQEHSQMIDEVKKDNQKLEMQLETSEEDCAKLRMELEALKDKDIQLKESSEMNLEKDGLLQEYFKVIDEAKKENQKLELQLETFEETCAKLRVELKSLKDIDIQLKESADLNLEKDGLLQEHSQTIDEMKKQNQMLEMQLVISEESCAKLRVELEALKDKDIQLKELSEMNLEKDGLLQEYFQVIDESKKEYQKLELQLETSEETCAKLRVELEALKDKDIQLKVSAEINLEKDGLLQEYFQVIDEAKKKNQKLELQLETSEESCAKLRVELEALRKDSQLKQSAKMNLEKDGLLHEFFQVIDELKKENQKLESQLETSEETCVKLRMELKAPKDFDIQLKETGEMNLKSSGLLLEHSQMIDELKKHNQKLEMQLETSEKACATLRVELSRENYLLQTRNKLDVIKNILSMLQFCTGKCVQQMGTPNENDGHLSHCCAIGKKYAEIREDDTEANQDANLIDLQCTTKQKPDYLDSSDLEDDTIMQKEIKFLFEGIKGVQNDMIKLRDEKKAFCLTEKQCLEGMRSLFGQALNLQVAMGSFENLVGPKMVVLLDKLHPVEQHVHEMGVEWLHLKEVDEALKVELAVKCGELGDAVAHGRVLEEQLHEKSGKISTLELEILQARETLNLISCENLDLIAQTKHALNDKCSIQEKLTEKMKLNDGLGMHITELSYSLESLNTNLAAVTDEKDCLQSEIIFLKGELAKLQVCHAEETEAILVDTQQMAEERRIYAEEKEKEVKLLEKSVEELECTVNVLENKVDIVKGEVERHKLQREDLELEVLAVKEQLKNVEIGDSDIKRLLSEKENKVQEAHEHLQFLETEIVSRDAEISKCKTYISELHLHAEAQAREYQQKFKALEAMADVSLNTTNPSSNKFEKNSKSKGSGSPFKCIGLSSTHQIKSENDEELIAGRLRIDELEAIAIARQKEIFILNTKLAAAESMTHDVIRDLLRVKLDMSKYASLLENQQLPKFTEKTGVHDHEFHEKEEVNKLKQQFNELVAEKQGFLEDIKRKQAELVASQVSVEKLHQRDQLLTAENELFKTENSCHKKRVIELESAVSKLSGQQNLQQRIHHHVKIKEENNSLKVHNGELRAKLHRTEALLSRVKEELVKYRAASGMHPDIDFDVEQKLNTKLKETEEERLQLARKLLGLCTCILEANGESVCVQDVNICAAENALEQLKKKVTSLERELEALSDGKSMMKNKRR